MHRGIPDRGPWWLLGRRALAALAFAAAVLAVASVLFIVGSLLIYGHVNW